MGKKKKNNEERLMRERAIVTVDSNVYCRPEIYIKMLLSQKKRLHTDAEKWQLLKAIK